MGKAYSYDFRQRVMQAIELNGDKKQEASEIFNISRNTINLRVQRKAATGDVHAKPRRKGILQQKITDWEKFRIFAKEHEDKTQVEMAALWEGEISARTISRALASYWVYSKKKTYGYRERDEVKRGAFLAQLTDLKASHLVYVDESGMDERDDYGYGWSLAGERLQGLKCGRRFSSSQYDCGLPSASTDCSFYSGRGV